MVGVKNVSPLPFINYITEIMNKLIVLVCLLFATSISNLQAQGKKRKCYANVHLENHKKNNLSLAKEIALNEQLIKQWISKNGTENKTRKLIVIPVVFHVVYHTDEENVSEAQLLSQLEIMNKDYSQTNSDTLTKSHPFKKFTGNLEVLFKIAVQDPSGNATTGITRTQTNTVFKESNIDDIKSSAKGGQDNWDPSSYLNIWVTNFDPSIGILGYATFPTELNSAPGMDGVVIQYTAIGNIGTAGTNGYDANSKGRTVTHEVGHWMNLFHIWGDDVCGDDLVADTEPADSANYHCPSFPYHPKNKCGSSENGEMYMNFMDYTNDDCMNMFTIGQVARMEATLAGPRKDLAVSKGCIPIKTNSINEINLNTLFGVLPNPSNGTFVFRISSEIGLNAEIILLDMLGNTVKNFGQMTNNNTTLNCEDLPNGVYFLKVNKEAFESEIKLIISK